MKSRHSWFSLVKLVENMCSVDETENMTALQRPASKSLLSLQLLSLSWSDWRLSVKGGNLLTYVSTLFPVTKSISWKLKNYL